ncbi:MULTISPECIES: amidophosphoribosyltransferase [Weeksella]|uniref:Amidophosphoribosyltransferase n=1 Tax=Weeksella virosa (strain ATCC 43766 / DSM 16922 / JCM 21250 / CCUG 30538 / CDC 9751 / IAM 14551 / NBRC 16016 / NCTC 11634 / CL345/78) TaxID=865938 RepID=F0NZG9_WEEVC|nr:MULTISPECIES: amidophosphoribosyltransferase [Weeksella]ADX68316.1 amidophosphoribosyltransferase [Weeksella virosa DSM 16922]MDK7374577.1 amidophosphoribosyltransferase [Weeksella virosa]MDK7674726.1 amidophosphoribosyltransferase [Weeksella virosa]OFM83102.1 amidophosphoribosyltransferase [Weeksella sp. HMSC059D05]SUP54635.1 Amidophosphoribosyltransferase precursor [Weeksella virosa]
MIDKNFYKKQLKDFYTFDFYQRNLLKKYASDTVDSMNEECGIFGVYSPNPINTYSITQFGLFALQHRGQEACGVSFLKDGNIKTVKKTGLVLDVFKTMEAEIEEYQGNAAIGHTRYTTAGGGSRRNIQPLYTYNIYGKPHFSIAHNGNLIEVDKLRAELEAEGLPFLATSDTEVLLRSIQKYSNLNLVEAIQKGTEKVKGAYSVLLLTNNQMAAFRDPNGIRPLSMGKLNDAYIFCSETCALDAVGAEFIRSVEPGEIVIVNEKGVHSYWLKQNKEQRVCAFEYIYFARPDSNIQGKEIYDLRVDSGRKLFEQSPVDADLVIGVPDSGIPSAIGYSEASGIPYEPILVKNRYMSRSFIVPSQEMRERIVNLKLNPIKNKIKGKRLVVLDDSIVRGTTSKLLIKILKEAGAKEIHFRSASPPIIAPCYLGIDMPSKTDLISGNKTIKEVEEYLQVDSLDFLTVKNLMELLGSDEHCFGCFTEKYPVNYSIEEETENKTLHID